MILIQKKHANCKYLSRQKVDSAFSLDTFLILNDTVGMEKIRTPLVVLERKGDKLKIMHNSNGASVMVTIQQLQAWAIQQLRKDLLVERKAP